MVVACPELKRGCLLSPGYELVGVSPVVPWVLVPQFAVLLGLEDGLYLRVDGRPIHMLFCCALLFASFTARHVAVGGSPLQDDRVASAKRGISSR